MTVPNDTGVLVTHNRLISLGLSFREDDRDCVPVVFYNYSFENLTKRRHSGDHKFCLINKEGEVQDTFASFTKPMSSKIIKAIENIL